MATPEGLVVLPATHDFGTVGQNEVLPADFTVTNNHRRPVRIVELGKSCSCVELTAASTDLAPGASTTVRVGWRTHGKRGKVSDTLSILYLVGSTPTAQTFRLHADVLPDVSPVPDRLTFGGGRPLEQTLTVAVRNPASAVRVTDARCSAEAVTPTVAADGRSVVLRYDPTRPVAGGVAHQLLLRLNAVGEPWLEVPVAFEMAGSQPSRSGP